MFFKTQQSAFTRRLLRAHHSHTFAHSHPPYSQVLWRHIWTTTTRQQRPNTRSINRVVNQ